MRAGRLRQWVSLQQRVEAQNSVGEVTWTWETLCQDWAEIAPVSGREFFAAQQVQSDATHNITMRYRSDVTPTTKMRIIEDCNPSVGYDIQSVLSDARRTFNKMPCVTRDAEGWRE